ncbi:hypothetical protein Cgig2_028287 [Carnegiea gigantea]|uniref:Transposase-associated domain-containing protein n=1 Tax=Carnegiea gigantea TaxID=171969 RepID=A0A9Q1GUP7_9CARY|nr:hypothetical protein Cgig2_028287 [Carnegiea gigantea]
MAWQRIEAHRHYSLEIIFTLKQTIDNSEQVKKRVEWMTCSNRRSDIYINGVKEFLDFAFSNIPTSIDGEEYKVPCCCKRCNNSHYKTRKEINEDLFINGIETFEEDALQQSDSRPLLNESLYEEDEDEVHAYSRDDTNDLVMEANNLNQPREFDGHGSENDGGHDDNGSDVDVANNDAHSISEDDIA